MKKLMIATIALISVGLFSAQVFAWGGGYCGGWGRGPGWHGPNTTTNPPTTERYQTFMNETAQIRQQLAAREGEYRALMVQPNPDPQKAAALSGEIASLREQVRTKAGEYGLNAAGPYGGPGNPYCYGPRGHHGPGPWSR